MFRSFPSLNSTGHALVPLLGTPPATKCLAHANTLSVPVKSLVCSPFIDAIPIRETKYGSSPNVSPTLPQRASQAISILGANAQ